MISARLSYFDFVGGGQMYSERSAPCSAARPRMPEIELNDFHSDVARSLQDCLEEILLAMCRHLTSGSA